MLKKQRIKKIAPIILLLWLTSIQHILFFLLLLISTSHSPRLLSAPLMARTGPFFLPFRSSHFAYFSLRIWSNLQWSSSRCYKLPWESHQQGDNFIGLIKIICMWACIVYSPFGRIYLHSTGRLAWFCPSEGQYLCVRKNSYRRNERWGTGSASLTRLRCTPLPFRIHKRVPVLFTRASFQAKFSPAVNGHNSTGFVQRLPSWEQNRESCLNSANNCSSFFIHF